MQLPDIPQTLLDRGHFGPLEIYHNALADRNVFYADASRSFLYCFRDHSFKVCSTPHDVASSALTELGVHLTNPKGDVLFLNYQGPYLKVLGEEFAARLLPNAPILNGLYRNPALYLQQGRLWSTPQGFLPKLGLFFTGQPIMPLLGTPQLPLLTRAFSDIHFTSEVYRANFFGWLLACFARCSCREFPLLILDATSRKQGKSTVANAVHYLLTGTHATPITHTGNEQEFEKRIATFCNRPGPNPLIVDNVRPKTNQARRIRSQFLAVATTNPSPGLRGVYKRHVEPVHFPIVIFTMNGALLESDLADRALRVVLTGEEGRFFDPSPLDVVVEHREAILAEVFSYLTGLSIPDTLEHTSRMGVFERIATPAAQGLGLQPNWNPDAVDVADAVVTELYSVVRDLQEEADGAWPTLREVVEHLKVSSLELPELTNELRGSGASTPRARAKVLRALVTRLQRRQLHVDGRRVELRLFGNPEKLEVMV